LCLFCFKFLQTNYCYVNALLTGEAGVVFFDRSFDFSRCHDRNTKPHTPGQSVEYPPVQYMINAHSDVRDSKADFEVQCLHTKQVVSRARLRSHCPVYCVSGSNTNDRKRKLHVDRESTYCGEEKN